MNRARYSTYVLLFFIAFDSPNSITPSFITISDAVASISGSPRILSNSTVEGLNAPAQMFNVWNSGGGMLTYSITADQSWLSCFPASGASTGEHDSITVSYSTESLSLGTYVATITISDPAAGNLPQTVVVNLIVTTFPQARMELNFEEGGGALAYDTSGNNNHGILYGEVVYTKDRAVGSSALSFDGIDDRVICQGNSSLRPDDISVSLWVKHAKDTSSPHYGGILKGADGNGYSSGFRFLDYRNGPVAQINFGDAAPIGILGTTFTMNEWCHLALTYDHAKLRLYQNGRLVVERPETRNINWVSGAGDLSIGQAQWYFNGVIDKVMIFGAALTAQMVQELYGEFWAASSNRTRFIRPGLPSGDRWRETRPLPSLAEANISRSPNILYASVRKGDNAAAQAFSVRNSGGGTLDYSISVDQSWLSCFPASGTSTGEHDSITVSYSTASLSPGTYSATVTISDSAAHNSPQTIGVSLKVTSFPQIIELNFEEGEGTTAYDSSGNNNNGIIYGGAVYTADRAAGSHALSFDGIDDCVLCRPSLSFRPDDISVALWVKHSQDTSYPNAGGIVQGAYGHGYPNGFRILDYQNSPLAQMNFGDAEPLRIQGAAFTMNEWSHLVLTYDHTKIRLYQNGRLVAERSETRDINWASGASDLSIGLAEWYFNGLIDKVMIFSSALTTQQVQRLYADR